MWSGVQVNMTCMQQNSLPDALQQIDMRVCVSRMCHVCACICGVCACVSFCNRYEIWKVENGST